MTVSACVATRLYTRKVRYTPLWVPTPWLRRADAVAAPWLRRGYAVPTPCRRRATRSTDRPRRHAPSGPIGQGPEERRKELFAMRLWHT